ncbi:MAG: glycoside hydrolase TIM-barrel-like domain-containing protein [Beijerinckiaceae bacterium]
MTTLVLQAAGTAIGGIVGGPIGASLGGLAGALGGAALSGFGGAQKSPRIVIGPRLRVVDGITSTEGAPIPRVYGRARIGGQMIWATRFLEVVSETVTPSTSSGGKGGGGGSSSGRSSSGEIDFQYNYYANFAIGLCQGPIAYIRRMWADGTELDLTWIGLRIYTGTETQEADPLIIAKEGADKVPAYRGLAYVVFESLPLASFGNRIPQLTFEVVKPLDGLAQMVRAVDIIPGATEFGYQPSLQISAAWPGSAISENRHQMTALTDWTASLDALQALCPNLRSVALVVTWFGTDLRAGFCAIGPRVDLGFKTIGPDWSVAGLTRAGATLVSSFNGQAAFGGTPSDGAVIAAIQNLRARGLSVTFYPFVMMDIPPGNALPDPYTGSAGQPAYPWRGRITCDPAPGRTGTPDGSAAAAAQVSNFFGSASPSPFEWSFRRFVLQYAQLCAQAGGVDAFLIGSELVALTRVRSASGSYPAAQALATLAGDVKAILSPATKVSYAADWTEYGAHVLGGGNEIRFPLDVVWSAAGVDFVGIDAYWPLSDWRDGDAHLDAAESDSIYDLDYLTRRVGAGEAFDWYYADDVARTAQIRTPITDGTYSKPWVFRQKDLVSWWSNAHVERVGGSELTHPTGWTPQSKPIWLTETGCPAVDRGANAPNVFPDAKSSEGGLPYFSRGFRDDLMQQSALEATIRRFDPTHPGFEPADNPTSSVYGAPMVDPERIHFWAWDARPFPAFPSLASYWSDAPNWETGHWLNGRLEGTPLRSLVDTLASEVVPVTVPISAAIDGFIDGYVIDRMISARSAIEPLSKLFGFDAIASSGTLRFLDYSGKSVTDIGMDDLVPLKDGTLVRLVRAQESELPHEVSITFSDSDADYEPASVLSRRLEGTSQRDAQSEAAVMMNRAEAQRRADITLQDLWIARETAEFCVRPTLVALEPGDDVGLEIGGERRLFEIERIGDGPVRTISARAIEPSVFDRALPSLPRRSVPVPRFPGPPNVVVLDLAVARGTTTALQYLAIAADPWPGRMAVWQEAGGTSYNLIGTVARPAIIGTTLDAFGPGPASRLDLATSLTLRIAQGALLSVTDADMFAGKTAVAIQGSDGAWEIFCYGEADLVGTNTYRLSRLIRGLGGEEALCSRTVPAGATVVLLDAALFPVAQGLASLGTALRFRVGPANRDHADAAVTEVATTVTSKALMPYAPVQASALRDASGIIISFTRRGRIDADAWEPVDVPLGEDREAYDVVIATPGGSRLLSVGAPSALYAAGDETADFGAPQSVLALQIYQTSATVGRGFPLAVTIPVH